MPSPIFALIFLGLATLSSQSYSLPNIDFKNIDLNKIKQLAPDEIEVLQYRDSLPPEIHLNCEGQLLNCQLDGAPCARVVALKLKEGASANQKMKLQFQCEGGLTTELKINLLGKLFPSFEVTGQSSTDLNFILAPLNIESPKLDREEGVGHLLILSPSGKILFYLSLKYPTLDFRVHHLSGKTYYSFLLLESGSLDLTAEGTRYILDGDFKFIKKLPWRSDLHEFIMLGPDDFYLLRYKSKKNRLGVCYINPIIEHRKRGKVVFSLDGAELLSWGITGASTYNVEHNGQICKHPLHLNAFQIVDSKHLFISIASSFLIFDTKKRKVDWIFGGTDSQFRWNSKYNYFFSHTPYWDPDKKQVSFFLNHLTTSESPSKFVSVKLNLATRKVEDFSILADNFGDSVQMGSGQILKNGAISIGLGRRAKPSNSDIMEFLDGKPTVNIRFVNSVDSAGYRVYRDE